MQGSTFPTPVPSVANASRAHFTSVITYLRDRHAAQRSQFLSWGRAAGGLWFTCSRLHLHFQILLTLLSLMYLTH